MATKRRDVPSKKITLITELGDYIYLYLKKKIQ